MHNMHMHCIWNPEGNILVILMNLAIQIFDLQKKYVIGIFKWYCYRLPIGFTTIHELHSLSENPLTYVCKRDLGEYPIQRWQHMATITSRMAMTAAMHNPYEATPFPFPCVAPIWALAIKKWISKLHTCICEGASGYQLTFSGTSRTLVATQFYPMMQRQVIPIHFMINI